MCCFIAASCMCMCALLSMHWLHLSNIPAGSEEYQMWNTALWIHTSWTPEELAKTLASRRSWQAGHIAARAKARHMHVSTALRSLLQSVAPIRTLHCARATQTVRIVHIYIYIYIDRYVCIYITVDPSGVQAARDGTGAPAPQPSQPRAGPVRLYAHSITAVHMPSTPNTSPVRVSAHAHL